jgi:hypothetical protein
MAKCQRDAGARFERECAKLLGVRRRLRCDWSESGPDLVTDRLVCECKKRAAIAAVRWLEQAEGYAAAYPGRVPVVFAREKGSKDGPVAILRAVDFLELLNGQEDPR